MLCGIANKGALPLKRIDFLPIAKKIMLASPCTKALHRIRDAQDAIVAMMGGLDGSSDKSGSSKAKETTTTRTFKGDLKLFLSLSDQSWDELLLWLQAVRDRRLVMTRQQSLVNDGDLSYPSFHEMLRDHPPLTAGQAAWATWEVSLRARLAKSVAESCFVSAFPPLTQPNPTPSGGAPLPSDESRVRKRQRVTGSTTAQRNVEIIAEEEQEDTVESEPIVETAAAADGESDDVLHVKTAQREANQQRIDRKRDEIAEANREIAKLEAANAALSDEIQVLYVKVAEKTDVKPDQVVQSEAVATRSSSRIRQKALPFSPTKKN